ncbi:hypothetical protein CONPUDRAFT_49031 [Coniophora puteana RWD-64-598 SS2]|uniref:Uncharacterized protein n=1 Tax=Coniophora puteana (strain RWD-64-598) TaxID=741705 RepID=A0A5M3N364_CONPW|nr:uncharacterized protein CONPUDRAFT_49031 [Coniophora puteana RWD-64-598 SS2]EIW85305.1 hypothetical protein CONPUDRAFT_49031 [Coniophora puteana RWD-64-598 SS2]
MEGTCLACEGLVKDPQLVSILRRIDKGVHENAPHAYQPLAGLHVIIQRKMKQVQALRLGKINTAKSLAQGTTVLDNYKRFVVAAAHSDLSRLDTLFRVCIKNCMSC